MKYEYKILTFNGGACVNSQETIDGLNKLGNKGWLLIDKIERTGESFEPEDNEDEGNLIWEGLFVRENIPH